MGALTPARIDVLGDKNRRSIKRDGDPELQPRDRVDALGGSLLVAYYAARNEFKIPNPVRERAVAPRFGEGPNGVRHFLKKALPYSPSNTREVCVCSLVSTDMADKDDVSAAPFGPVVSTNGLVGCQARGRWRTRACWYAFEKASP